MVLSKGYQLVLGAPNPLPLLALDNNTSYLLYLLYLLFHKEILWVGLGPLGRPAPTKTLLLSYLEVQCRVTPFASPSSLQKKGKSNTHTSHTSHTSLQFQIN